MTNNQQADAQKKFTEALEALTGANKIKWDRNHFGDRCAEMSISLVGIEGKTPTLRFLSTKSDGSACAFEFSDESVRALGNKIKGETLPSLHVRPPRSPLGGR